MQKSIIVIIIIINYKWKKVLYRIKVFISNNQTMNWIVFIVIFNFR